MSKTDRQLTFDIYRYDQAVDKKPYRQRYTMQRSDIAGIMVLDALTMLREQDPSLGFRYSCGGGVCGSDGMSINGKNGLACMTELDSLADTIYLNPLPGMPVVKDLIVDLTIFMQQYSSVKPYLQAKVAVSGEEMRQTPEQRKQLDGLYECILCACCSASCPSYWWNPTKFVGPAGLLWACRFIVDSRDKETAARLADLEGLYRLYRCRSIMNCAWVCPKGLNPNQAISTIRRKMMSGSSE